MTTADDYAAQLDTLFAPPNWNRPHVGRWDIYRSWDPEQSRPVWKCHVTTPDQQTKTFTAPTLTEALAGGCTLKFPPIVPRQPTLLSYTVAPKADTSKRWYIAEVFPGGTRNASWAKTRKAATALAAEWTDRAREERYAWHRDWAAIVAAGVEGTDWDWADR